MDMEWTFGMSADDSCRLCFKTQPKMSKIDKEVRENFHFLTNIQLIKSPSHSNVICPSCTRKLKSTCQYIRSLVENESRLANDMLLTKQEASDELPLITQIKVEEFTVIEPPKKAKPSPTPTPTGKVICPYCNRRIIKSNYESHIEKSHTSTADFACDMCDKSFNRKDKIQRHMNSHIQVRPFECPKKCGKSFYSRHGMDFHIKMHHEPLKQFICEICAKAFKLSYLLQEHIDSKHSGVRYKCSYENCDKEYGTIGLLRKHVSSIHESRLEPCAHCGEMFRSGFSMYQHVRINHRVRKYACEYENCGKRFAIKTQFRDHMKMHTGKKDFLCDLCDASYHIRRNLKRHVMVVHQKSRFNCQVDGCSASLRNKDNYREHLRKVHAGHERLKWLLDGVTTMKPVFMESAEDGK